MELTDQTNCTPVTLVSSLGLARMEITSSDRGIGEGEYSCSSTWGGGLISPWVPRMPKKISSCPWRSVCQTNPGSFPAMLTSSTASSLPVNRV